MRQRAVEDGGGGVQNNGSRLYFGYYNGLR